MKHLVSILFLFLFFFGSCTKANNNNVKDEKIILENLIQSFNNKGYPSYYLGAYIKNKTLFVITSKNNNKVRKDLEKRGKGTNFIIETFKNNFPKDISNKLDSLSSDFFKYPNLHYYAHYVDQRKQKVIIMLSDTTKESIDFFKKNIIESPYIKFEYTSPIISE